MLKEELADPYVNVNDGFNWFAGCLHGSPGVPYDPLCGAVSTENSKAGTVELLPNPATDQVLIRLAEPIDGVLTLYDVSGRKMQTHAINTRESVINISGLKHGIYTVVVDSKVRVTARLIVH